MNRLGLAAAIIAAFAAVSAGAVEPDEMLSDPALEARAREISRELRCVVCQSQNIDDSNAPLAKDMRVLVRERLKAGDADEEVIQYFVDRYGEYVLLKPRLRKSTVFLWAAPLAALLAAAGAVAAYFAMMRKRTSATSTAPRSGAAGHAGADESG
jgi:cytochrome c-type biogenesis protein CcmH